MDPDLQHVYQDLLRLAHSPLLEIYGAVRTENVRMKSHSTLTMPLIQRHLVGEGVSEVGPQQG